MGSTGKKTVARSGRNLFPFFWHLHPWSSPSLFASLSIKNNLITPLPQILVSASRTEPPSECDYYPAHLPFILDNRKLLAIAHPSNFIAIVCILSFSQFNVLSLESLQWLCFTLLWLIKAQRPRAVSRVFLFCFHNCLGVLLVNPT